MKNNENNHEIATKGTAYEINSKFTKNSTGSNAPKPADIIAQIKKNTTKKEGDQS